MLGKTLRLMVSLNHTDDFLDQAEESEEELGGYDQLASAMAVDAPPDGDSSESEAEVLDSDEENLDGSSGEAVDSDIDGLPAESASEGGSQLS